MTDVTIDDTSSVEVGGDGGYPSAVGGKRGWVCHREGDQDGRVPQRWPGDGGCIHQGIYHAGTACIIVCDTYHTRIISQQCLYNTINNTFVCVWCFFFLVQGDERYRNPLGSL